MPPRHPKNTGDGMPPPPGDGQPPIPPNGSTPPIEPGGDDDGEERLRATLAEFFQGVTRRLDELMEARVADLRKELDPAVVVRQTADFLGPKISSEVQSVVNDLSLRIQQVERLASQALQAAQPPGGLAARPPTAPTAPTTMAQGPAPAGALGKAEGFVALGQSLVDYGIEKIWPLFQQQQMMKMMGMRDLAWAKELHNTNPMMAQMMANTLAPDQLANMMSLTIPNVFGQGLLTGAKQVRSLAQLFRQEGAQPWPGATPSSDYSGLSPGPSPAPGGTPPAPSAPRSGASMAQRPRPKPKLRPQNGLRSSASEPEPRDSGPASGKAAVRRLADLA